MARRLRSATLCRASLRYGGERISGCGEKRSAEGNSQIGWSMALYLRGKISVGTNDLSPKEATEMSRDIKYIGMDVHKEAIVIAVLNGSGKLVMETILETKASSILQFLHGLRGELHVTWEEGTWAAWLYDRMSRRRLMYSVGIGPPEEKSELWSLNRIRGGNEANEVD
jgi:hypothetical protein